MPTLTFRDLAEMTGGAVVQGEDVVTESVVIDSREVKPGSVFFAIKGERLDGHRAALAQLVEEQGLARIRSHRVRIRRRIDGEASRLGDIRHGGNPRLRGTR